MEELMTINKMTSMQIAEVTGKQHKNILADIRDEVYKLENGGFNTELKFQPSERKDNTGRKIPYYELTKEGVLQLAARYDAVVRAKLIDLVINGEQPQIKNKKFNSIKTEDQKQKEIEARYNNSLARKANILLKIASTPELNPRYRQVLQSQATTIISGQPLLPLPEVEERTYSSSEIGEKLGISANKVGKLANEYKLKTEKYGKYFHDKSRHSAKEVESFRYYEAVIPVLKELI